MPKNIVQKLDLRTLKLDPNSYIDENLEEYFSDIVYTCKQKNQEAIKVSLLYEHKSYQEKYPHLQLLRYILRIYTESITNQEELKVVIPIILYHGKRRWKYQKFGEYFKNLDPDFQKFIPEFEYLLTDLSKMSDRKILALEKNFLINSFLAMKHQKDTNYLLKNVKQIFIYTNELENVNFGTNLIETFFVYLAKTYDINQQNMNFIVKNVPQNIKNTIMTGYDRFIKIGEEKGIKKTEAVFHALLKSPQMSDAQIAQIAEVDIEFVKRIRNKYFS